MLEQTSAVNNKRVRLVTSRPRKEYETSVSSGETFSGLLEKIGLGNPHDYMALKPSDQTEFRPDEEVFPHVGDGSKIHLVMRSDVG